MFWYNIHCTSFQSYGKSHLDNLNGGRKRTVSIAQSIYLTFWYMKLPGNIMHFIFYRKACERYLTLTYYLVMSVRKWGLTQLKETFCPFYDRNKYVFTQLSLHRHLGNLPSITTYKTKNMLIYFTIILCINNTSIIPNVLNILRVVYFHLIKKKFPVFFVKRKSMKYSLFKHQPPVYAWGLIKNWL